MRRMQEHELEQVSNHMLEIFFEEIDISTAVKGINQNTARTVIYENLYSDTEYFYKYGDVFIYDDDISGIVVFINGKKFSNFKKTLLSLKSNKKILEAANKEEIKIMTANARKIQEAHSFNWYKKRKNIPFYLAHIGIDKEKRGKGICREMLEFVFDYAKKYNNEIVLETFNIDNVHLYEHFGFEVIQTGESKDKTLTEYRMIKKLY